MGDLVIPTSPVQVLRYNRILDHAQFIARRTINASKHLVTLACTVFSKKHLSNAGRHVVVDAVLQFECNAAHQRNLRDVRLFVSIDASRHLAAVDQYRVDLVHYRDMAPALNNFFVRKR